MPLWFWGAVVFVYGTVVGSFLNVCICRMPYDQSILKPPSHCPKCKTRLKAIDLFPLVSFLALGRKCRYCGAPIGWRYFAVELTTGLLMVALFWKCRPTVEFFAFALLSAALVAVFYIDIEHWIIPDELSMFGIAVGVGRDVFDLILGDRGAAIVRIPVPLSGLGIPMIRSVVGLVVCGGLMLLVAVVGSRVFGGRAGEAQEERPAVVEREPSRLAAAVVAILPLAALSTLAVVLSDSRTSLGYAVVLTLAVFGWFLTRETRPDTGEANAPTLLAGAEEIGAEGEAMGGGDIKLAAAIGAVLGLKLGLLSLFFSVFVGSLAGIGLAIAGGRRLRGAAMPFGTMMAVGVLFTIFFGQDLLNAYLGFLNPAGT